MNGGCLHKTVYRELCHIHCFTLPFAVVRTSGVAAVLLSFSRSILWRGYSGVPSTCSRQLRVWKATQNPSVFSSKLSADQRASSTACFNSSEDGPSSVTVTSP